MNAFTLLIFVKVKKGPNARTLNTIRLNGNLHSVSLENQVSFD